MRANYNITINFHIAYDIDDMRDLKSGGELASSIGVMVADQACMYGGSVSFDVEKAEFKVTEVPNDWREHLERRFSYHK